MDNFWFTLVHELSHVFLHLLRGDDEVFVDDTDRVSLQCDGKEKEANDFCSERLIPKDVWAAEQERLLNSFDRTYLIELADRLEICPAIIAGRVRYEKADYALYQNMLGNGEVRVLFEGAR